MGLPRCAFWVLIIDRNFLSALLTPNKSLLAGCYAGHGRTPPRLRWVVDPGQVQLGTSILVLIVRAGVRCPWREKSSGRVAAAGLRHLRRQPVRHLVRRQGLPPRRPLSQLNGTAFSSVLPPCFVMLRLTNSAKKYPQ